MLRPGFRLLIGCTLAALSLLPASANVSVVSLTTPTLIELPNDGALYGFQYTITISPGGVDGINGGLFPVVFQDSVIGVTQFDWSNLNVPPGSGGQNLTYRPTLDIGCTNSPTPEVFGPLGTFNNGADTAEYAFPTLNSFLGAVKIECNVLGPNGPPFTPTASNPKQFIPPTPGYYPGPQLNPPGNLFNTGSGLVPDSPVPEPNQAPLLGGGVVALIALHAWGRSRSARMRANRG